MRGLTRKLAARDTARRGGSLAGMIDGSIPYSMTAMPENLKAGDQHRPPTTIQLDYGP